MIPMSMIIYHINSKIDRHGGDVITSLTYVGYVNFVAIPQGLILGGNNALTLASIIYPLVSLALYMSKARELSVAKRMGAKHYAGGRVATPVEEMCDKIYHSSLIKSQVSFFCMMFCFLQLGVLLLTTGG